MTKLEMLCEGFLPPKEDWPAKGSIEYCILLAKCNDARKALKYPPLTVLPGEYFAPRDFDNPKRCKTFIRRLGRKCRRWSVKGQIYCRFHGGLRTAANTVRNHHIPMFYSKTLGKTLGNYIDEALGQSPSQQMSVLEELALIRHPAYQKVQLYDAVLRKLEAETDPKKQEQLRNAVEAVSAAMVVDLKEVVKVAETAARIDAMAKDKVSVHSLGHIVNQLTRLLYDVCGDDNLVIAQAFEERARTEIRLPTNKINGTIITPDQEVLEMDDSVPRSDEDYDDN